MKLEKLPLTTFSPKCSKKLISPKNEQPNVLRLNIQRYMKKGLIGRITFSQRMGAW